MHWHHWQQCQGTLMTAARPLLSSLGRWRPASAMHATAGCAPLKKHHPPPGCMTGRPCLANQWCHVASKGCQRSQSKSRTPHRSLLSSLGCASKLIVPSRSISVRCSWMKRWATKRRLCTLYTGPADHLKSPSCTGPVCMSLQGCSARCPLYEHAQHWHQRQAAVHRAPKRQHSCSNSHQACGSLLWDVAGWPCSHVPAGSPQRPRSAS